KGARQTGKTYLVEAFGRNEYQSFIEINFLENPQLKQIFEGSISAKDIYKKLTLLLPGKKLIPNNTLIFLDEIQQCSKARTALKFLAQDNSFDVIASGSLLGLHYGTDADSEVSAVESIPVGYETQYVMYSLDFEEFLWAYGYSSQDIDDLRNYYLSGEKVPAAVNNKFTEIFREFIVVGGMPEVVKTFSRTKDFNAVKAVQNKIIASYDDDISNHAKNMEKAKIRRCYNSLPAQLARENKKFSYSQIEKKTGEKKYGDSIMWLKDSNIVLPCYNVHEPYVPLNANANASEFKLYINDTGLLMAMYGDAAKQAVMNNTISGNAKGGIYENVVAESLVKNGYSLHYYKPAGNAQEIEFVIEKDGDIVPVEVKAGNTSTISLNEFIKNNNPHVAFKLINGNVGFSDTKHTVPHYMVMFL
ncbi:MAG: DUF4143 domain-containing protein, partial [Sphaerochaetaceae bacterium]|nr:DUF4143 domain-containing protein [Sphaerochaetaceae bacterium]